MADRPAVAATVARNIRVMRKARGWSAQALANRLAGSGSKALSRGAISKIENGDRGVTVDELYAFARLFDTTADALALNSACEQCCGSPPPGYACLICGAKSSESGGGADG